MTQKLRAPYAFAEGLASAPSIMWRVTPLVPGSPVPSPGPCGTRLTRYTGMHEGRILIYIESIFLAM